MFKFRFRTIRFVILSGIILVFQATLLQIVSIGPVRPDLVLLLVIFFALYNEAQRGMYCGIILGLGVDILSAGILGINCLIFGGIGLFSGFLAERVYKNHFLTKGLLAFAGSIFSLSSYYLLAVNFHRLPAFFENPLVVLGTVTYTTLVSVVFFSLLEKQIIVKMDIIR